MGFERITLLAIYLSLTITLLNNCNMPPHTKLQINKINFFWNLVCIHLGHCVKWLSIPVRAQVTV